MQELLEWLNRTVAGTPLLAVAAAMLWGVLSVVLSPCHLASIPLIVAFVSGQGRIAARRAFLISCMFALGILVTIGAVGGVTAAAGKVLGDVGSVGNYVVAGLLLVVGLYLLGVVPLPWSGPGQVGMKRKGALAALGLGLIFGIAVGPCTFAYMSPVLAVTFKLAATNPAYGVVLLAAFGVGHCSVIVLAGTYTGLVQRWLNWNEQSRGAVILKRLCGTAVLAGGLYMVYVA